MTYRFKQIDVFSATKLLGNPVCVFLSSEGLSKDAMQRIARWTNLSETTFVGPSQSADYSVRIFTPEAELPFAGHPTLGTAWALMEAGVLKGERWVQECAFGNVIVQKEGDKIFFTLPQHKVLEQIPSLKIEASVGIPVISDGILFQTGPHWVIACVDKATLFDNITINKTAFLSLGDEIAKRHHIDPSNVGITLYAVDEHKRVHVRTFFIAGRDVLEDPVCGSGNAAVALHIQQTGRTAIVGQNYEALQGKYLNRDGHIFAKIGDNVSIGGRCHTIFDGHATPL